MSQSLAKLTSTATQTLSLLLERERAQTFAGPDSGDLGIGLPGLHAAQITRNLNQLRSGVLALEANGGNADASRLLRGQYERMRLMLGEDGAGLEPLTMPTFTTVSQLPDGAASASASPFTDDAAVPPLSSNGGVPRKARDRLGLDDGRASSFAPYSDDPERGPDEPEVSAPQLLQQQRRMMDEQDTHLDALAQSIGRQHHISTQINNELETHTGLLHSLDTDLDETNDNLARARSRLAQFARGVKGNGSTVTIALLIVVLLILILQFKT